MTDRTATVCILIAAIIWGSTTTLIRVAHLPPPMLTGIRCLIPTITSFIALRHLGESIPSLQHRLLWSASVINVVRMYLYVESLEHTSISKAIVVCYSSPIFSTIYASLFLREQLSLRAGLGVLTGFIGVAVVYSTADFSWNQDALGMSLMLLASALYGLSNVIVKKELSNFSLSQTIFTQNVVGAVIFLPAIIIFAPSASNYQISVAVCYAAAVGHLAFYLYFKGLRRLSVAAAVTLTYLEVVVGIAFAVWIFGEVLSLRVVIGGALILLASGIAAQRSKLPAQLDESV